MTQSPLDHDFRPTPRTYRQYAGLAWNVAATISTKNPDGSLTPVDLTSYVIGSSFEADDGTLSALETSLSTTDPTVFYYGQSSPQVSGEWIVTLAAPGGPPTAYYAGRVIVYDQP